MCDDFDMNFEMGEMLNEVELVDIEINSPVSEEDLRLAELENLIF